MEYLSIILSFFKLLIEGFKEIKSKVKLAEKTKFQRKIISIHLILQDIIETGEEILELIADSISSGRKPNQKELKEIKELVNSQRSNLRNLSFAFRDETSENILKILNPGLQSNIAEYILLKNSRIQMLIFRLWDEKFNEIYDNANYAIGLQTISDLKKCSDELTSFIKEYINIEDIIRLSKQKNI